MGIDMDILLRARAHSVGFSRSAFATSLSWWDRATSLLFSSSCLPAGFSRAWNRLIHPARERTSKQVRLKTG
ncbi:hypothetical protein B7486_07380 [cyanobacterium TDX16]|nr:hypothetical protein B7486_07380 [cyanobacterium TDX16]